MIKNPNHRDWTEKELELIKKLQKHDFKDTTKDEARKVWERFGRDMYPNFEDYWKEVIDPKKNPVRCELCRKYPCWQIQELFGKHKIMVICWIFHGSACSTFEGN